MKSTVLSLFFLAIFAGVLSAFSINDIVVISKLEKAKELNGSFGVVKSIGERIGVYTFKAFEAVKDKPVSECFQSYALKPENLTLVTEADWAVHENSISADAPLAVIEAALTSEESRNVFEWTQEHAELSPLHSELTRERALLGIYFNSNTPFAYLSQLPTLTVPEPARPPVSKSASSSARAAPILNVNEFVIIEDGRFGVVERVNGDSVVVTLLNLKKDQLTSFIDPASAFQTVTVQRTGLIKINREDWNRPQERSLETIFQIYSATGVIPSSFVPVALTSQQEEELNWVARLIKATCYGQPEAMLRNEIIERKVRLIGAWVNKNYDHDAMVYVCEFSSQFRQYIERVWNGIGAWLA